MRSLCFGLSLSLALGAAGLAEAHDANWGSGKVDWSRLGTEFAAFVDYPSSGNAKAVRALLPLNHVSYDGSPNEKATSEIIYQGLPMLARQVEAGDSDAVQLAFDLFVVTDGAASEALDIMLGKLIRTDPNLFLEQLEPREQRFGNLGGLVGNLGEEYVDRMRASCLETRARIASLERVTATPLNEIKARCINELKEQAHSICR